MSLVAVTSRLALVGAELPVVKFVDPDQMVCDIIESRVYKRILLKLCYVNMIMI